MLKLKELNVDANAKDLINEACKRLVINNICALYEINRREDELRKMFEDMRSKIDKLNKEA